MYEDHVRRSLDHGFRRNQTCFRHDAFPARRPDKIAEIRCVSGDFPGAVQFKTDPARRTFRRDGNLFEPTTEGFGKFLCPFRLSRHFAEAQNQRRIFREAHGGDNRNRKPLVPETFRRFLLIIPENHSVDSEFGDLLARNGGPLADHSRRRRTCRYLPVFIDGARWNFEFRQNMRRRRRERENPLRRFCFPFRCATRKQTECQNQKNRFKNHIRYSCNPSTGPALRRISRMRRDHRQTRH